LFSTGTIPVDKKIKIKGIPWGCQKKDLNHFLCILRNPISVFQGMLHESGIIGQGRSAFLSDFSHLLHTQPQEKHP
jgi:hypothetical protein